ncbi:MAG: MATE family efflux transporter [Gemmatimonadetes bacterium]|nr:MATE family efflux transporter [Gemmatimonadota bacterium]
MSDGVAEGAVEAGSAADAPSPSPQASNRRSFDRSIVEGPIPSAVWKLAWPTMLQNVIGGLQGIVDHAMVGHFVGFTGNAAIGVAWQIFLVVIVFITSLFTGMGVLVARFTGADQPEKVHATVYQAMLTAAALSLGVMAPLGWFLAPSLLGLVNAEPSVQAEALPYLRVMFLFSFGMMMFFMISGALRAAGDARTPLRLAVVMTVLNGVLNAVLIAGLGPFPAMGTVGAAWGTVIAGAVVTVWALASLVGDRWVIHFHRGMSLRPDWGIIRALFRFGLPTGFQGVAMNVGGVLLLRFIGSLEQSAEAQAAYAVSYTQLFSLITWTSVGLMGATAAVAGQNLGAGRPDRTVKAVRVAAAYGLMVAVVVGSAFVLAPRVLLGVFGIDDVATLDLSAQLLGYLAVSGLFVTVALTFTGGLQGTGDTKSPMWISIVSQLVLPLGMLAVIDFTRPLRPEDVWLAIVLGHICRALLSAVRFGQGDWREIEVDIGRSG